MSPGSPFNQQKLVDCKNSLSCISNHARQHMRYCRSGWACEVFLFEKARAARHFVEKSGRSLLAQKEYEDMQIDNMNKGFAEAVFKRKQPVQAPSKLCVKFHVSTSPSCHRLQFLASGFRYHTEAPACYNRARQHSKCPNSSLHTSWTANCRVLSHVEVWFPQAVWIFLPITTLKVNPSNGSYNNSSLFFGLGPLVPNEQLHCEQSPAAPFGHFGFTTSCDFKLPRALRLVSSSWANLSRRAASFLAWSWPQEIMTPCNVIFLNNARRQKNLNERSHTLTSLKRRPEAKKDVWKAAKRSLVLIYNIYIYVHKSHWGCIQTLTCPSPPAPSSSSHLLLPPAELSALVPHAPGLLRTCQRNSSESTQRTRSGGSQPAHLR